MADFIANLLGGKKPATPAASQDAGGFADFAGAAAPSPAKIIPSSVSSASVPSGAPTAQPLVPYTKWYRIWERTTRKDWYNEMVIIPLIAVILIIYWWGTQANRKKAKKWASLHLPAVASEYAVVGFPGRKSIGSTELSSGSLTISDDTFRENSPAEYISYATGRQNVAFLDIKVTLLKRFSPLVVLGEAVTAFFFESLPATQEIVEATAYAFDGKEKDLVAVPKGESVKAAGNSTYDGFVWAVVNKDDMKRLRDERYDLSLTTTKEHAKLPAWLSIMSESAEITDTLLTSELAKAVESAGDDFVSLIITDQPTVKPTSLNETVQRKRIFLTLKLSSSGNTTAIWSYFLRLPDILVSQAHFRPEVTRKVRQVRDEEIRKIQKASEVENAELRKEKADKDKKEARDSRLKGMTADEQRKFLDKEREKESRKAQKRRTMRG